MPAADTNNMYSNIAQSEETIPVVEKTTSAIDPIIMHHILSEESKSALSKHGKMILSEAETEPYFTKAPMAKIGKKGYETNSSQGDPSLKK